MKIILFCGAFDPVHKAHIKMAQDAIDKIGADKLIFIPSNLKFFKNKKFDSNNVIESLKNKISDPIHRINMIKIAIKGLEKIEVSDYEIQHNKKSYTIQTLDHFINVYGQENEYFLIIGSDNLTRFNQWKNYDQILQKATLICFKRGSVCANKQCLSLNDCGCESLIINNHRVILFNDFNMEISSTQIRKNHNLEAGIQKEVLDYINDHGLYAIHLLEKHVRNVDKFGTSMICAGRILHSIRVAEMAKNIMLKWDPNQADLAYSAGMYHDILKCMNKEDSQAYVKKYADEIRINQDISWKLLHPYTGAHLIKTNYNFDNELILNAIRRHNKPFDYHNEEVTLLDKVLYCADKLEPERIDGIDQVNIEYYRKLVYEDIETTFQDVYDFQQTRYEDK